MTRRAVLDSNVIVSGLGWSGAPARIVEAVLAGELVLVMSAPLLAELRRVLAYPKLAKAIPDGSGLADLVEMSSVVVEPRSVFDVVEDESDNRVLEAAVDAGVDHIVSGDGHLLGLGVSQGIPILTPAEFVRSALS
ncbi:MAG TPA: putative toxin-antitoxin system toxin component, PIN family [Solirubrobacteraceae bacterium]|nr:putative toxin-antitoxin system toxin component, PIN family [Solirubrobacteraceae bacterium]